MISQKSRPRMGRRDILRPLYILPSREHRLLYPRRTLPDPKTNSTNVPSIAMSFSDLPFAYGPFAPHHIPRQYIESYFSHHQTDSWLSLNTTVEDISVIKESNKRAERWKLVLRKYDAARRVDVWWEDIFDAVILANGHYSVPFVRYIFASLSTPAVIMSLTVTTGSRS
jgi:hypothetical protein